MDTTTINFAIDKMAQAIGKVAPSVQGVSEKYVSYVVTKEIAEYFCCFVIALIAGAVFKWIYSKGKANWHEIVRNDDEPLYVISGCIFGLTSILLTLLLLLSIPNLILAITNPEMFVINKLIEGAKE